MSDLEQAIQDALNRREHFFSQCENENTNAYRLFHGSNEGFPGLTLDRYGPQLLIQSFHSSLSESQLENIMGQCSGHFEAQEVVYNDRSAKNSRRQDRHKTEPLTCQELGINYLVQGKHRGQDPLLFLDFRAARRWVKAQAQGLTVLNLFAYTGGIAVSAALGGAREVWNIDFAQSALEIARQNAELNKIPETQLSCIHSDFFPAIRQLAGLDVKQRRKKGQKPRPYLHMSPREFDLVILDPPRWARSPFGTVDLIRDYPSLLKPSLLATAENGRVLCSNNVAQVALEDWLDVLERCARKAGRPIQKLEVLQPEGDFPSRDGQHPLKMAILQL